ncbi:hypothetical protein [Rhodocista pekingensis]|uniref:DUF4412 domain-containing protein n=1 Tax=Rhodocista pekingensis TaxID=201185 RepID=A0ABW2KRF9_9PROT
MIRRSFHAAALSLAAGLLCLSAVGAARADGLPPPTADYSARQRVTAAGDTIEARLFHSKGSERREFVIDGVRSILIRTPERILQLQPELGMALEMQPGEGPEAGPDPGNLSTLDAEAEGQETLAGLGTTRYRVRRGEASGGFEGRVWSTADGIYVRVEGTVTEEGRSVPVTMELADVERGPQDPALFSVPPGMRTMTLGPIQGRVPEAFRTDRK